MENSVVDFFQISENSDMTVDSSNNKPPYVSLIKINGKPILPPLISEETRKEMQKYKQKAIEMELRLAKQKDKNPTKHSQLSSEISSIENVPPSRQSTPSRPSTLNLTKKTWGKTFVLSKSKTESSLNTRPSTTSENLKFKSSPNCAKNLDQEFKSSIEQRLASEDDILVRNRINKYQQSPIIEEQFPERVIDSDSDSRKERKRWSPLRIDNINSLRVELPSKDFQETDDNVEVSLDESQNTPETVTESPNLMRQNSYTLLTPSPALLNFLETQKEAEHTQKPQSGRKTWDLTKAKKKWDPSGGKPKGSEQELETRFLNKKNSSSLDSFSGLHDSYYCEYSMQNSLAYDSGTSLDSNSPKSIPKLGKVKCKIKGKKVRSLRSVPLPKPMDEVPLKTLTQGFPFDEEVKDDLSYLSNLLLKMKVDHERQKKELEEKQQSEMKKLEILFQRREAALLGKSDQLPRKYPKSIYSHSSRESRSKESDPRMMGDVNHNRDHHTNSNSVDEPVLETYFQAKRPHSAKDFHPQFHYNENDCSRRTRSMDFNHGNQDTDLDVSFQDDFMQSKDTTLNNEYIIESDSISNLSSHSSTISSDNRQDHAPLCHLKKFQGISSEEFAQYNQAATVITAAARGFLMRRLLRTAHVQGLITTLRDAISCATQLHNASDLSDSDIDLMRRLGRQIEAAWDAVYSTFFGTDIPSRLQLIAADRERLRAIVSKTPAATVQKKRISSATRKFLDRKKGESPMSKSQTSNGFTKVRICSKMAASYPSPYFSQKLK